MLTVNSLKQLKNKRKIVMLTAYDYLMASYLEQSGIDLILVGDSMGMVFSGHEDTLPVEVEDIVYHTKAVKRGAKDVFVAADMPFMSYQASVRDAKKNAGIIMKKTGANAVKLEGGAEIAPQIKALVEIGIPVIGHTGMQPQSVKGYGGYPVFGKTDKERKKIVDDCIALEKAGVFMIVLEKVKSDAAKEATRAVSIPVIGIGSGPHCDGQVLVTHDLLGAFEDFTPKFVKKYENIAGKTKAALKAFVKDVKTEKFPGRGKYF